MVKLSGDYSQAFTDLDFEVLHEIMLHGSNVHYFLEGNQLIMIVHGGDDDYNDWLEVVRQLESDLSVLDGQLKEFDLVERDLDECQSRLASLKFWQIKDRKALEREERELRLELSSREEVRAQRGEIYSNLQNLQRHKRREPYEHVYCVDVLTRKQTDWKGLSISPLGIRYAKSERFLHQLINVELNQNDCLALNESCSRNHGVRLNLFTDINNRYIIKSDVTVEDIIMM